MSDTLLASNLTQFRLDMKIRHDVCTESFGHYKKLKCSKIFSETKKREKGQT